MFGFDSQGKELKIAMQTAGADMAVVKEWLKTTEKMKKQYESTKEHYDRARASLLRVIEILETLEKFLVSNRTIEEMEGEFFYLIKELKKLRGNCDHEFLISAQDREFHLTYDTILKLGPGFLEGKGNGIILQSEIENLIFLAQEAIEKEKPDLMMLSFFYLKRSDKDICELPPGERIAKIRRVFSSEYLGTITKSLLSCIEYAEKYKGDTKNALKMTILLDCARGQDMEERAKNILKEFYAIY